MPIDKPVVIFGTAAVSALIILAVLALAYPNRNDMQRLGTLTDGLRQAPRLASLSQASTLGHDARELADHPIFVMTTGAGAYTEKALTLFGVSITPTRKAALIAVNGGAPSWVKVGDTIEDLQLVGVDASMARFDTPLGEKSVVLGQAPAAPTKPGPAAGVGAGG